MTKTHVFNTVCWLRSSSINLQSPMAMHAMGKKPCSFSQQDNEFSPKLNVNRKHFVQCHLHWRSKTTSQHLKEVSGHVGEVINNYKICLAFIVHSQQAEHKNPTPATSVFTFAANSLMQRWFAYFSTDIQSWTPIPNLSTRSTGISSG